MSLYEKLLAFCENNNQYFYTIPDYFGTIFKAKVSDQTIALLQTDHPVEDQMLIHQSSSMSFETFGFYRKGVLYMSPKASIPLRWLGEDESKFHPYPLNEMKKRLNETLTATLRTLVGEQPPLYSDARLTNRAKEVYMTNPDYHAMINCEKVFTSQYFNSGLLSTPNQSITRDCDIEAFLDDGDKWVHDRVNLWLSDKRTYTGLVNCVKDMLVIEAIIKEVKDIPEHSWNRKLRFLKAIEGKQSVVLDVKCQDTILTFHYDAHQLRDVDGSFYLWWIPAPERAAVESKIDRFTFDDILDVMYRGKIIYLRNEESEKSNVLPAKFLPKVQEAKKHFQDLANKLNVSGQSFAENVTWLQNAKNDDGQSSYENVSGYDDDHGRKCITLDYDDVTSEIIFDPATNHYTVSDICTVFLCAGLDNFIDNCHW